ncbi:hypothetical protein [Komagataeibacter sp. NFXK3]
MKNKTDVFVFILVSVVTIPSFLSIFSHIKCNLSSIEWGDLATWVSAVVSLLALIAAITAAIWSKREAEKQNENSTIISLMSLVQERASKINDIFKKISDDVNNFFQESTDGYLTEGYFEVNSFTIACSSLSRESSEALKIISRTIFMINQNRIPDNLKKVLIEEFFISMSPLFISECLLYTGTNVFFSFNDKKENCDAWATMYYENIKSIQKIIVKNGLFDDTVKLSRRNGLLYAD